MGEYTQSLPLPVISSKKILIIIIVHQKLYVLFDYINFQMTILYLSMLQFYFPSSIYRELAIQRSTKCSHCTTNSSWIQTAEAKEVP